MTAKLGDPMGASGATSESRWTSRLVLAFAFVGLIAFGVGIVAVDEIRETSERRAEVTHTYEVRTALRQLNLAILEIEAAGRAGAGPGSDNGQRLEAATTRARQALTAFTVWTGDNPVQQSTAGEIRRRLDEYLSDVSEAAVNLPAQAGFGEVVDAQADLAAAIDAALREEARLLAQRLDATHRTLARSEALLIGAIVLVALSLVAALLVVVRALRRSRRSEIALEQQGHLLTTTFEAMTQGLVVVDAETRVLAVNRGAQQLLGVPSAEAALGRPFLDVLRVQVEGGLLTDDEAQERARILASDIAAQRASQSEVARLDGRVIEIERQPYPGGMVTTYTDITERRRTERMKNEFISTVSHELRTPLTSIRGSLGLIVGGAVGEVAPKVREMVAIAHSNSERLVRLINDILDIEKIESGRLQFDLQAQPLAELLGQAMKANAGYFQQYEVQPKLVDEAQGSMVRVDGDRFIQVMNNLLSNAAKFTAAGGSVTVLASRHDGRVRITVQDEGPGIPDSFRERIFGKFEQADSSDSRRKGGTGLGLSIAKAIVERLDGRIWFETELGVGTRFHVELPEVSRASTAVPAGADGRPSLLVVEDDQDVARLLTIMLEQHGWRVTVAHSVAAASDLLRRARFDAMTLDIMLPDEDGLSFFRRLRSAPATRDLPVVVVSAKSEVARQELNGDAIGIVDWLEKPIDQERLGRAIRQALGAVEGPASILHVEDDPDIVRVLGAVMGDEVEVVPAMTLAAARTALAERSFALVIVDVGLPDGSGLDLLDDIRRLKPPPPVVIFSAHDVDPAMTSQAAAALVKSRTDNDTLHQTIRGLIAGMAAAARPGAN
ncbi:hypothetical protein STAQ_39640 [Allostella sp. ATCC 35155]|nr:hypothetical protein STAQ_39640 [Stella sp. ATCC 35155]